MIPFRAMLALAALSGAELVAQTRSVHVPQNPVDYVDHPELGAVVVKFREGLRVRLLDGRWVGAPGLEKANEMCRSFELSRLFERPAAAIDADRDAIVARLPQGAVAPPDLNNYYVVRFEPTSDWELCGRLNELEVVEVAYPKPSAQSSTVPSNDLAPPTPDYTGNQVHHSPAPIGVDYAASRVIPGGRGEGIAYGDVEYGWTVDHEDISRLTQSVLWAPSALFEDHGTAVVGLISGDWNSYGITGLADQASVACFGALGSVANAINQAAAQLPPGSVILLEQQTLAQGTYVPVEWVQQNFDAILNATMAGYHVIEAAGNGSTNLDLPQWQSMFDRSIRDCGAVVIGATAGASPVRASFSNWGSIVDVNSWGFNVMTTGYGDTFNPDQWQRYTSTFGGTSSASAIITGVSVALLGAILEQQGGTLSPSELRDLFRQYGTPIQPNQGIGLRANLRDLLGAVSLPNGLDLVDTQIGGSMIITLEDQGSASYTVFGSFQRGLVEGPWGRFLLDPAQSFFAFAGSMPLPGSHTITLPVPNDPVFNGFTLFMQAVYWDATGVRLSNSVCNYFGG